MLIPATALAAMGSSTPDPLGFVKGACIMATFVAVLVGLTKFMLLGGVDAFPLLAIAMAPIVMAGALLLTIPKPTAFLLGFLAVALTPGLMNLVAMRPGVICRIRRIASSDWGSSRQATMTLATGSVRTTLAGTDLLPSRRGLTSFHNEYYIMNVVKWRPRKWLAHGPSTKTVS
jgi:hypothetical protein